jgi:DNA repair protein RadD
MKHPLRPYQREACVQTIRSLRDNPLLVAPTGAGKTTMGVYIAGALASRGVVWLAHRTELIDQAVERFSHHDITAGVIKAGREPMPDARVQVASVQTLARRDPIDAGVVIVDEAHRAVAASYRRVIPDTAALIGLTATPFRNDGRGLGDMFGTIVEAATTADLVEAGTLMNPEVWIVRPPDMSGVTRRAGEYAVGESAERVNTPDRRADIVSQWQQRCSGARTLAFAVNVDHSKAIAEAFVAAGVPAEHVDAETPPDERAAAVARLASSETLVLSNCMLFTEGFDLPAVESLIIARPTESLGLHMQMVGRVMRTSPGKTRAVVHDHAGNHVRLGRVTQPLIYSLEHADGVTTRISEPLGLTTCGECYKLFAGDACPDCGAVPERDGLPDIDGAADMEPMTDHDIREAAFERLCQEQGDCKDGWVLFKFKEEFDEWPPVAEINGAMLYVNPDRADQETKRAYYKTQLKLCIDKGWKEGAASYRYKELFGVWPKGFVTDVKREIETDAFLEAFDVPAENRKRQTERSQEEIPF